MIAAFQTTEFAVLAVAWGNPYSDPPAGRPRILWSMTVPRGGAYEDVWAEARRATGTRPGDGYALTFAAFSTKPRRQVSQAGKASIRQKRLRRKIEAKAPLFADQLLQRELAADPDYFTARTNRRTG